MSLFLPSLKRAIETLNGRTNFVRTLLLVTDKSSPCDVGYLHTIPELEKGWSVTVTGLFDVEGVEKNIEYIRHISSSASTEYEVDDGTTIKAGSLGKFIRGQKVDVLAFDLFDGTREAIDGFPFEDNLAERIIINKSSTDGSQIERQMNNYQYLHVDSGIYIPSQNVVSKFEGLRRKKKQEENNRGFTKVF